MKIKKIKFALYGILAIIFLTGVFALGAYAGASNRAEIERVEDVLNKEKTEEITADFEPFWKVWNLINEKYPGGEKVLGQEKVWGAISGLAASLDDPYTVFFPPQESKLFSDTIKGSFGGVGMEIGIKDKILTVISPLKDTPAYRAGVKANDKILKIDDTLTTDLSIDEAVSLIRGDIGTTVKLTIVRENEDKPKEISIVRAVISIPTLDVEEKSGVFIIKLYNFSGNSANLFRGALRQFAESGANKLVLDLRGNPGGYLESAVDIASWFLPAGKPIVIEDFGDKREKNTYRSKGYDAFNKNLKMVVLVDAGSASASEILAGALSEHGVATLVGEKTYGKGSVQELIQITPDTSLKITIAKWLTPKGRSISEHGIEPDIAVEITKEDLEKGRDPQTEKAIEILR